MLTICRKIDKLYVLTANLFLLKQFGTKIVFYFLLLVSKVFLYRYIKIDTINFEFNLFLLKPIITLKGYGRTECYNSHHLIALLLNNKEK